MDSGGIEVEVKGFAVLSNRREDRMRYMIGCVESAMGNEINARERGRSIEREMVVNKMRQWGALGSKQQTDTASRENEE